MGKNEYRLSNKSKIIFIALNGIGNLLLCTPVFTNLKKNLPNCKITVLTLNDSAGAVKNSPYIDEVIVYPAKKWILPRIKFLLGLRKKRFDFSFYPYPNVNIMSALIGVLAGAKNKANFDYMLFGHYSKFLNSVSVPVNLNKHDVEKNLDLLRAFNLKIYSKKLFINIERGDKRHVSSLIKDKVKKGDILIGMHVGSKEPLRIWPPENFAELVKKLSGCSRIKIALVGGKIEMNIAKGHDEFKSQNIINLINRTTIQQTTALIQRCKLFITTDSGPMHMAAAAGTKVLAIYLGPHIRRTAPYGKEHIVILSNREYEPFDKNKNHIYVDKVTPEVVFERAKKELGLK